jgi:hypothetical protein
MASAENTMLLLDDLFLANSFSSSGHRTGESGTVHGESSGAMLKTWGAAGASSSGFPGFCMDF